MVVCGPLPDEAAAEIAAAYADASAETRRAIVALLRAMAAEVRLQAGLSGAGVKALDATARSFDAVANCIAAMPPAEAAG